MADDPPIKHRHQVIALGGGDERRRHYDLAALVPHTQQQLIVWPRVASSPDRHDRLIEELETLLLERTIDARDPLHLLVALRGVALLVDVDAVAAQVLRH